MGSDETIDWKGIRTKMTWAALCCTGLLVYPIGWGVYWTTYETSAGFTEHLVEAEQAKASLEDIVTILKDIQTVQTADREQRLTLFGKGVPGTFGGNNAFVRINTESDARLYVDQKVVLVTNVANGNRDTFTISGTFEDDRSRLLAFSRNAADLIGLQEVQRIKMEPVLEK